MTCFKYGRINQAIVEGRKFCAMCHHRFFSNEFKTTSDGINWYCGKCDKVVRQ